MTNKISKILIIRLSSFGDVLLTTPVIRALRNSYPNVTIDFVVKDRYKNVLTSNPNLNFVYSYSKNTALDLNKELEKNNYDLILDLQRNIRTKRLLRGIKTRQIYYKKESLKKFLLVHFKKNLFNEIVSVPQKYINQLPTLKLIDATPEIYNEKIIKHKRGVNTNKIGFCPGSRHLTKMWPPEYFIDLGNKIIESGNNVVLIGGKEDFLLCKKISSAMVGEKKCIVSIDDPKVLAEELSDCDAVVCNDSGMMHLAHAVETPLVIILGSSVKEFGFIPTSNNLEIIENLDINCRPCSHIGKDKCPKKHFNCMHSIEPEMVLKSLNNIISRERV